LAPDSTTPQGTVSQAQPKQGTGDSGGGNLYKGKPLESYIKSPVEYPSTNRFVLPALDMLPATPIANTLSAILKVKTWYFVPGPLEDLPSEKIGSAVPTQQAALQDFNQVWIDKDKFEKMSESEQAELIFHETLMGMKLLKFTSPQSACLLIEKYKLKSFVMGSKYADLEKCQTLSNTALGAISELTVTDYSQIREMASLLNQKISEIEKNSDHSLTWWHGERNSEFQDKFSLTLWPNLFNAGDFSFQQTYIARDIPNVTMRNTLKLMQQNLDIGYKLSHGYDITTLDAQFPKWKREYGLPAIENKWVSNTSCDFQLNQKSDDEYEVSLQVGSFKKTYAAKINTDDPLILAESNFWFNAEIFERRSLIGRAKPTDPKTKVEKLVGYFDAQHRLRFVEASEVLDSDKFNGLSFYEQYTWQDSYLKGYYYLCALDASVDLGRVKKNH
jgi:hypothetical protein